MSPPRRSSLSPNPFVTPLRPAPQDLWEEALLKEYNLTDGFDGYTMSVIQFGYVALFSAAFPLAPLAMINNLVQTRVDAHKICKTRRVLEAKARLHFILFLQLEISSHSQGGPLTKGRSKRSDFFILNVRISGSVNTESIWSLQTCVMWTSVCFSRVFLYLVFAAYDPT